MEIELKKEYIPLILIAIVGIVYIYLASNAQMLGEDEAVYFYMANTFLKGEYTTYSQTDFPNIFSPLVSLIDVIPFAIFGATLSVSKVIIALLGTLTIIVVYLTGRKFGFVAGMSSVAILLSITLFTQYMFINYLEVPITLFSALAIYLFLQLDSIKKAVATGSILAMSFYAKGSGLFLILVFSLYFLARYFYKKDVDLKIVLSVVLIPIILISPFIVRNVMLFKYPYVEGVNFFFESPSEAVEWLAQATSELTSSVDYYSTFGYVAIILGIFGSIYIFLSKEKRLYMPLALTTLFLIAFIVRQNIAITESRELTIIFPMIAVVGAFFLEKLYEKDKKFLVLIALVLALSIYMSISIALGTSMSQRYSSDYIQALQWIGSNTPVDAKIFTAYGGSLGYFANRTNVWVIEEFPEIMTTQDSTYIHDTLKSYNVSYILIWNGILAQEYIIPESNLLGAFTYNFVNTVINDTANFNITYQNQNNIVFRVE